jgi:NADH dehydrogenase
MNKLREIAAAEKHVVIVGGGFAGLNCAKRLASDSRLRITLIDKNNYQQFQPLLYQVATGTLSPANAAFNLREVFVRHKNVEIKMSEVVAVDLPTRSVKGKGGDVYQGDFLVLAAGTVANFFGIPGADRYAFPMYSLEDAEHLRSRILELLEAADLKTGSAREEELQFLVVGAGPTGVETAGAIADILRRTPKNLYADVDLNKAAVTLVDMGPRVLRPFMQKSQEYAAHILEDRAVRLRLGVSVKEVTASDVLLSDGSRVPAKLVIWAGGLKASPLSGSLGIKPGRGGRVDVQPDLTVAGYPGVYALGDFANTKGEDGKPLPQLASVAQQAGRHCADNIAAEVSGMEKKPFAYFDKGIMAMVGRNAAVAEIGANHYPMMGVFAFAAWLGIHSVLLTTVRAQMDAFFEWAWDYFGNVHVDPILDRPSVDRASDKSPSTQTTQF